MILELEREFFPEICTNMGRSILVLYMAWLPFEDETAGASEKLVLKYKPNWSGAGETKHRIDIPDCYRENFELVYHEEFTLRIPFTRESWNGRMKACRGIGASLTEKEISMWEQEHRTLLGQIAIGHYRTAVRNRFVLCSSCGERSGVFQVGEKWKVGENV